MTRLFFTFLSCCVFTLATYAQTGFMYDSNNQVLTENRYSKVEGSPYFLKGWTKGIIYDLEDGQIKHDQINYNGDSDHFDVLEQGDKVIELNAALYKKVVLQDEGQIYTFINRVDPEQPAAYFQVIYLGDKLGFFKKFQTELEEQGVNYGVSSEKKKFVVRTKHFIMKDGKLHDINRTTKKIVDFLDSPALKKEVKSRKLNLKKDDDLAAALQYYEERLERKQRK